MPELWDSYTVGMTDVERAIVDGREVCLCAAIRMPDGDVVRGHRHNNCYDVVRHRMEAKYTRDGAAEEREQYRLAIGKAVCGFLTSRGRFVDRREGMALMKASGLPSHHRERGEYFGDELFSENLYPDGPIT